MVRIALIIVGTLALILFAALAFRSRPPVDPSAQGPGQQFTRLGCARCHGQGRPYSQALKAALGKPAEQVAEFIRNPQSQRPGTPMPSYESMLTHEQALALARWLQSPDNPLTR